MSTNQLDKKTLSHLYVDEKLSVRQISDKLQMSVGKIFRLLKKYNIPIRDKSSAQKNSMAQTGYHPTKGKKMDDATKKKIAYSMSDSWKNLTDDEKLRRKEVSKENWDNMDPELKKEMKENAFKALREAAKSGSKLEKYLQSLLLENGYKIVVHRKGILGANDGLEVDILIPAMKIAIEVNGISHYEDVWQDGSVSGQKRSDAKKYGLLAEAGYVVILVIHTKNNFRLIDKEIAKKLLLPKLEELKTNFPTKREDKIIKLEIK